MCVEKRCDGRKEGDRGEAAVKAEPTGRPRSPTSGERREARQLPRLWTVHVEQLRGEEDLGRRHLEHTACQASLQAR